MATYEWFRTYKMPAGKPANEFAFNGEAKGKDYTYNIIAENYRFWQKLNSGDIPQKSDKYDIACYNSPHKKDSFSVDIKPYVGSDDVKPEDISKPSTVKEIVEHQQRSSPHGTSELSNIVSSLAAASVKAASEGPTGIINRLKEENLAGLYQAGNNDALSSNEKGHYTVFFNVGNGVIVYGVYQKTTPHTISFSLSDDVTKAGYELVAAAFAQQGKFTFTTKHGAVTVEQGKGVSDSVDKCPSVESDNLLAVKAPLAFFD